MPQRGSKKYSGFIAHYANGKTVKERENYFSTKLNKKCATNWSEIDKENLVALELIWNDNSKFKLTIEDIKEKHPDFVPSDWFFSQSGYFDMHSRKITVVSRNIGYIKDGVVNITSVNETSGNIRIYMRAVK